jgi:hexulose-6-phosphate isomerase
MKSRLNRREFLAASAAATASIGLGVSAAESGRAFKTQLKKALINDRILTEEYLQKLKEAGYHGVEGGVIGRAEAEKCRARAEKLGLKIHSVIRGWAEFNSADDAKVKATFDRTVLGLETAQGFGADAVLLVPCRIGGMAMPKPWDFEIDFDDKTGHVKSVVKGDNAPYQDYIKAHNHATDTSTTMVKKLIPYAEKEKVVIALENVWNNLWVKPAIFKHFVASFQSPWVQAYFDIGNHVKYAPPEEWILALGKLLAKLHAKDFKIDKAAGNGGQFVNIREGDVNWPVVRQAIETVGYNGFLTIEGGNCSPEEHSQRLELIFAGK